MLKKKLFLSILAGLCFSSPQAFATRQAAIVIDADTGRVVQEIDAAQRWYPASLTKVMTLYLTFSALKDRKSVV